MAKWVWWLEHCSDFHSNKGFSWRFRNVTLKHNRWCKGSPVHVIIETPRVVKTGAMGIFPLTPVDTGAIASQTGTLALSSEHKNAIFPFISTAFSLRYFSCAAQKWSCGCWTRICCLWILYCTGMREVKFSAEWAYGCCRVNCSLTRVTEGTGIPSVHCSAAFEHSSLSEIHSE